jgi:hypothetical protein
LRLSSRCRRLGAEFAGVEGEQTANCGRKQAARDPAMGNFERREGLGLA